MNLRFQTDIVRFAVALGDFPKNPSRRERSGLTSASGPDEQLAEKRSLEAVQIPDPA
jgi:hypothetical protein